MHYDYKVQIRYKKHTFEDFRHQFENFVLDN